MTDYEELAARGMAAVNADLGEGWVDTFDLDDFILSNPWMCVLGQAYAGNTELTGYSRGLDRLSRLDMWTERFEFSLSCGFTAETVGGFPALTEVWRRLISEQKARRGVS